MTNTAQTARKAATIALTVAALTFQATSAFAVSSSVKRACIGDYLTYCSSQIPGTKGLTRCMRRNGPKLSKRCVGALVKAGYVSKAEVSRKSARRR
ncbi:MAG: hypothetical protein ACRBCJ_12905 [Hyphomicrobiaceae bacterium]